MKIEITNQNFEDLYSRLNEDAYITENISGFDADNFKLIMSKYFDIGYHYVGSWENENECINGLVNVISPMVTNFVYLSERFVDTNPKAQFSRGRNFSSTGKGVGEISPINSVIGQINTPSSKTNTEVATDETETDPTLTREAYKTNLEMYSITELFAYEFAHLIVSELNSYF